MHLHPGTMAVTLGCQLPGNNGHIVRVVRKHTNTPEWDFKTTPTWWCESSSPMQWRQTNGREVVATEGPIPEAKLFPIQGPKTAPVSALQGIPRCLLVKPSEIMES